MSFTKKRIQPYIEQISVRELTKIDKAHLDNALKEDYDGTNIDGILDKAVVGFCQIWRLGKSEGIIITEIIQRDEGRELWLSHMAGKGLMKKLNFIEAFFAEYGQKNSCNVMRGTGLESNPRIQKVYSSRWKCISRIYERKI